MGSRFGARQHNESIPSCATTESATAVYPPILSHALTIAGYRICIPCFVAVLPRSNCHLTLRLRLPRTIPHSLDRRDSLTCFIPWCFVVAARICVDWSRNYGSLEARFERLSTGLHPVTSQRTLLRSGGGVSRPSCCN